MKTLKFRSVLAEMILRGEKKTTFRLFDDKDIRAGDELELVNWATKQPFGKAVVLEAYDKEFEQLEEADFVGHEKYMSKEQMYATFREFYGDRVVPETVVRIVRFRMTL